jgi:hypothetical protein
MARFGVGDIVTIKTNPSISTKEDVTIDDIEVACDGDSELKAVVTIMHEDKTVTTVGIFQLAMWINNYTDRKR